MSNKVLEKAARAFQLPAEIVAGVPKVEIIGGHELRIENHKGIISYDPQAVLVSGGEVKLLVKGEGFTISAMNALELRLEGQVFSVELRWD